MPSWLGAFRSFRRIAFAPLGAVQPEYKADALQLNHVWTPTQDLREATARSWSNSPRGGHEAMVEYLCGIRLVDGKQLPGDTVHSMLVFRSHLGHVPLLPGLDEPKDAGNWHLQGTSP